MTRTIGPAPRPERVESWSFKATLAVLLSVLVVGSAPSAVAHPLTAGGHPVDDFTTTMDGVRVAVRVDHHSITGWTVMPPPGESLPEPTADSCADYLRALRAEGAVFVGTVDLAVEIWAAQDTAVVGVPEFTLTDLTLRQPYEAEAVTCLPWARDTWESDLSSWWPHTTVATTERNGRGSYRSAAEDSTSFVPFEVMGGHVHTWPLTLRADGDWVMGEPEFDLAVNGRVQRFRVPARDGPISLNSGFHDHQWGGRTERVWCEQPDGGTLLEIQDRTLCPAMN